MADGSGWYVVQSGTGYAVKYYKHEPSSSVWSEGPYPTQGEAEQAEEGAPQGSEAGSKPKGKSIKNKSTPGTTYKVDLNPFSWLSSAGGSIASGIEQGFVSLIKDFWNVAQPFVEIGVAITILVIVLRIFFNPQIQQLQSNAASAAIVAAVAA